MKKIITVFIAITFLVACKSSSKQLETGNYDAALEKSAKKIKKNPGKFEEVDTFNEAYRLAYQRDNTQITRLKQEGNPANWGKIYALYMQMRKRQDLAESLPPVGINYEKRDFSADIATAKTNATEYAYAKGTELLNKNNRFDARKAYERFLETKGYNSAYKDIDDKLREAQWKGTTNVFFKIEDNAKVVAPQAMMNIIQSINIDELDKGWKNYDTYIDTNRQYHYSIILNLQLIEVSPEQLKETVTTESKDVPDGFDYVLDANGNVTKDTLGNDIKIPRFKTITCQVVDFHQNKTARLSGTIEYYDNSTDQLLKTEPITSDAHFEHHYAIAQGDVDALKPETHQRLSVKPLPFPPDEPMLIQAGEIMKQMTKDIIVRNESFLK
ncbi:MAG: hypothetical protein J5I47_03520 [Vicingus serpentipes]|nr:hypothetical protein [Vicingus serpentipes]